MQKTLANSSLLRIILATLVILSFVGMIFHHHDDGLAHHDCPVCRLVQTFSGIFILALATLLIAASQTKKLFSDFKDNLTSLFHPSSLKDRAPPIISR